MTTAAELASYASSFPSFRNRIINGDMRIDQRNAGASITATNGLCLDRWVTRSSQSSKYSVEQSTDSPNSFNYSLKVTSLSSYSIISSDYFTIDQRIETANIQDFAWGNASGKSAILSFWVKSSLTGTFSGSLSNYDGNPTYGFTYQISIADTWEKKVISIPCPTIGSWSNTLNGGYVSITWGLGVGNDEVSTSNNSWVDENKRAGSGGVSIVGTSGATWYITGVQLEEGTVATPFEHRPIGTELALCQRYFERINGTDTNIGTGSNYDNYSINLSIKLSVEKRTDSIAVSTSADGGTLITAYGTNASGSTYPWETSSPYILKTGNRHSVYYSHAITGSSAGGPGTAVMAFLRTNQYIDISAEL